jgi:hypothetical protein
MKMLKYMWHMRTGNERYVNSDRLAFRGHLGAEVAQELPPARVGACPGVELPSHATKAGMPTSLISTREM